MADPGLEFDQLVRAKVAPSVPVNLEGADPGAQFDALTGASQAPARNGLTFDSKTQTALDRASATLPKFDLGNYVSPEGQRMGIRPGHFLDIVTGAPGEVRRSLGLDSDTRNQFNALARVYGKENVSLSPEGRFIARNQLDPETGQIKDIMINPPGFDTGDLREMGAQAFPMLAGMTAAIASTAIPGGPLARVLYAAGTSAVAQETVGAIQDAIVRKWRGDTVNATGIAKQRSLQALVDGAAAVTLAGVGKLGTKVLEAAAGFPFFTKVGSSATSEAAKTLETSQGVRYPLTPGQEAESNILLRGENILGSRPGSAGIMDTYMKRQQAAEQELRRRFHGLSPTMTDDELAALLPRSDLTGEAALRQLGVTAENLSDDVERAAQGVASTGTREVQSLAGVDLENPLSSTQSGANARLFVNTEFDTFHDTMQERYKEFLSRPEIRSRNVSGNELAAKARGVENEFVAKARKGAVTEPLETFVPPKFRAALEELKGLKGRTTSVNDLKIIRTSLDNNIKEGIAIPGTDVAQFQSLRKAVNDSISSALEGMDKLPSAYKDTAPLTVWNKLNTDYASGMSRFDRMGIREMLVKEGEAGSLGNTEIAQRIMGNSATAIDRYNEYKAFFGADSPEFKALQQTAKEQVLGGSIKGGSPYINGARLASNLDNMHPLVAKELFGTSKDELYKIANVLEAAKGSKLDLKELTSAAQGKSLTAASVQNLIDAEEARTVAYNNTLIKAAAKGTLGAERIQPSTFASRVVKMDPGEASKVWSALSDRPELQKEVRALVVEDLWNDVQVGVLNNKRVSSALIEHALGDKAHQTTLGLILGEDTLNGFKQLADVTRSRDFAMGAFKGGLAAQSDIQKLLFQSDAGEVKQLAARYLLGTLYSGPLRRSVVNVFTSQDRGKFLNALVASEPFLKGVVTRFGSDGAVPVVNALREMVEPPATKPAR